MAKILHFKDEGQDFLTWTVQDGTVVDCSPFQGWVWNGTKIIGDPVVGKPPKIKTTKGEETTLKYKIVKIEEVPDMAECVECGYEVADPGVGVRCENNDAEGKRCGGRLERKGSKAA